MSAQPEPLQYLLSLPPASAEAFATRPGCAPPEWFAASDPPGGWLGSAGGTAHLLVEAWRATGGGVPLGDWLWQSRKLIIHGGGQSRRLPAYAPVGKPLMPIPVARWSVGQRLDQCLMDLQIGGYRKVLRRAAPESRVLVGSGDVLLHFDEVPRLPNADVVILGIRVPPETASQFGVLFVPQHASHRLITFRQKPSVAEIQALSEECRFLVDTGLWLLSERAVAAILQRCGWDPESRGFAGGAAAPYELYAGMGLALGEHPQVLDPVIGTLSSAAVELPEADFFHLGTSRQMIEAVCALQNRDARYSRVMGTRVHPDQITQNSVFDPPVLRDANHTLWVENSFVPATWRLACDHVLTGVPENAWDLRLEPGVCLDFVPVRERDLCIRCYAMDDAFSGAVGNPATRWLGRPAREWFAARDIGLPRAGISPDMDLQEAPLFPVMPPEAVDPRFLEWLFAAQPEANAEYASRWVEAPRLSAAQLCLQANLERCEAQRTALRYRALCTLYRHRRSSVFYRLDLENAARLFAAGPDPLPPAPCPPEEDTLACMHERMWRSAVRRYRGEDGATEEQAAFGFLRQAILDAVLQDPVMPSCHILSDQIIWARAPVRLDLAGGWTDTPPYCLQHGGSVTNVAVDLNGQPPVQVFVKLSRRPDIVIRSIDLGVETRVESYEALDDFGRPDSDFALAKAALALAGFLPRFHARPAPRTLREQLESFGGGIEVSLLAAMPQGSGLGTSSILAATLLGALSELCGLGWDARVLVSRTLALEQLLTTGGGWQDQAGGILRGVKLLQSDPGPSQVVTAHWLPEHLFADAAASGTLLLYYTGITRLAKNILAEIVRGMFLNSARRLAILRDIGANAHFAADAIQRSDYGRLCEAVSRSWELNQQLDEGTNPPSVQAILDRVAGYVAAAKLLGAGGGGYLLLFAKDEEAGRRIRRTLAENPPNARARFVEASVSSTGLQITRS